MLFAVPVLPLFACSDADDAKLQADLAEGYLRFLEAKDQNKRMEGTRLAKRTKKAKVRTMDFGYVGYLHVHSFAAFVHRCLRG